VIQKRNWYIY